MSKLSVKINGSEAFAYKSRCKSCKSGPKVIHYYMNPNISTDSVYGIREFYESIANTVRVNYYQPTNQTDMRRIRPSHLFDSSSSAFRKLRAPNMRYEQNADIFSAVLNCACGKTCWAFTNSSRKHISNRKCSIDITLKEISDYRVIF